MQIVTNLFYHTDIRCIHPQARFDELLLTHERLGIALRVYFKL